MGFVLYTVAEGQVLLGALWNSPVNVSPSKLHIDDAHKHYEVKVIYVIINLKRGISLVFFFIANTISLAACESMRR